jgi:hypothetical protein
MFADGKSSGSTQPAGHGDALVDVTQRIFHAVTRHDPGQQVLVSGDDSQGLQDDRLCASEQSAAPRGCAQSGQIILVVSPGLLLLKIQSREGLSSFYIPT